jgi:hypothetical protein
VKEEVEQIVLQMYRSGLQYSEAVREFQRTFLATVLRETNANQVRTAENWESIATPCDYGFTSWNWTSRHCGECSAVPLE